MTRQTPVAIPAGCAAIALLWLSATFAEEPGPASGTSITQLTPTSPASAAASGRISIAEIDRAVLQIERISAIIVFQDDKIVTQRFAKGSARDRPTNVKSASKSLLNALVGIALQRGDLKNLDEPIATYLPEYFKPIPAGDQRRNITIRHLLTLSSGQPSTSIYNYGAWVGSKDWLAYALNQAPGAPPGTRFTYSTGDTHLLSAVLTRATGIPLRQYAQRHLFGPLGMTVGGWDRDPQGFYFGGNNIALSPDALLRFGRLYLDRGVFEGRQILSSDWIEQSWTPRFRNSSFNGRHDYAHLWWHARFSGHATWFAWGYGGQFLFVIPSLDAVVVLIGNPDTRSRGGNEAVYALLERTIVPYLVQHANSR